MTCSDYTNNSRPVGVGYDNVNRARSLMELSSITVANVSSTGGVFTSSIYPGTGVDLTIYGRVSAVAFLGAGGGGVSEFIGLSDVEPGTVLTPGSIVVVNSSNRLSVSTVDSVVTGFQPLDPALTTIAGVTIPGSQTSLIAFSNETAASILTVGAKGSDLIQSNNATDAKNALSISFQDLVDTQNYAASDANRVVVINNAGTGVVLIPSSTFGGGGGGGTTNHSLLTNLNANDHPQYTLSATNLNLSNAYSSHAADSTIHFTSAALLNHFVLSSTNLSLSNAFSAHEASASVHFTSGSLSSAYVTTGTNLTLSNAFNSHVASASVHFTSGSLSSAYSQISHSHVFSALSGLSDTLISPSPAVNSKISWDGSKWVDVPGFLPFGGAIEDLEGIDGDTVNPAIASAILIDGSPFVWNAASSMWEGRHLPDWFDNSLEPYLSGYVLSSTNINFSNAYNAHVASASVHFTSGELLPHFVTITANTALSSTVTNHIASAVHWTLATLNTNYLNASGDSANASFFLQNLSSTVMSATTVSAGTLHLGGSDGLLHNRSGAIIFSSTGGLRFSSTTNDISFNQEVKCSVPASDPASLVRKNELDTSIAAVTGVVLPLHTLDTSIHFTSGSLTPFFLTASGGLFGSTNFTFSSLSAASYSGISLSGSLRDVAIGSVTNGQSLVWSSAGNRWVPSSVGGGGGGGISNLYEAGDVVAGKFPPATSPDDNSPIVYSVPVSKFVTKNLADFYADTAGSIPHDQLANLNTGDPHPQYVLKEGVIGINYIIANSMF